MSAAATKKSNVETIKSGSTDTKEPIKMNSGTTELKSPSVYKEIAPLRCMLPASAIEGIIAVPFVSSINRLEQESELSMPVVVSSTAVSVDLQLVLNCNPSLLEALASSGTPITVEADDEEEEDEAPRRGRRGRKAKAVETVKAAEPERFLLRDGIVLQLHAQDERSALLTIENAGVSSGEHQTYNIVEHPMYLRMANMSERNADTLADMVEAIAKDIDFLAKESDVLTAAPVEIDMPEGVTPRARNVFKSALGDADSVEMSRITRKREETAARLQTRLNNLGTKVFKVGDVRRLPIQGEMVHESAIEEAYVNALSYVLVTIEDL